MENDKKLNMFKETWEAIQKIKNEKTIPYSEKGKLMAKVVIEKYNLKHPLYLVDFIKKIFIDNSNKGFTIEIIDFKEPKKDEYKGALFGKFISSDKKIQISNKISNIPFQRFIVAYEIAHIFIDSKKDINSNFQLNDDKYYRFESNSKKDIYNDFATNLLVIDSISKPKEFCDVFEISSVWNMSKAYKVPIKNLAILYEKLLESKGQFNG